MMPSGVTMMTNETAPAAARPGILRLLKAYLTTNRIGDILVLEGKLKPEVLEQALLQSKNEHRRVGEVLVETQAIRRFDLYSALTKQFSVRTIVWTVAFMASVATFSPRVTRADERSGYEMAQSALYRTAEKPIRAYPALFGSSERKSSDLSAFTKWTAMFVRYNGELDRSASARIQLASFSQSAGIGLDNTSLTELATQVDHLVNKITYVDDKSNWGKSDYWATPIEFLKNGGDCEDFAITKYIMLKSFGVSEDRLRIAVVHDMAKNTPHAILIVYTDDGAMVLDNQSKTTRFAKDVTHYKPIFSINAQSWWLHTKRANVQVASASR